LKLELRALYKKARDQIMKLKRRKGKKDPRVMSEIVIAIALGKKPEETKNGAKKGKKK